MTVSMGMLIFAGLGYALEKDEEDTMFYTLPQTLYWAIITMTSTGYGDISPKTSAGMTLMSDDCRLSLIRYYPPQASWWPHCAPSVVCSA